MSSGDVDTSSLSWGTDDVAERFARGLRLLRTEWGLSVRDMADATGELLGRPFHYTAISKIEAGTRSVPIDEAVCLADVLDVNVYDVIRRGTRALDLPADELRAWQARLESQVGEAKAHADEKLDEAKAAAAALGVFERTLRGVAARLAELDSDDG